MSHETNLRHTAMTTGRDVAYSNSLFYYGDSGLLSSLWDLELKLASPIEFNDPFEFLPSSKTATGQAFCLNFQKNSLGNYYILCLSQVENNVRMWAQYGGNHSGLMLEFDRQAPFFERLKDAGHLLEVDYQSTNRHLIDPELYWEDRVSPEDQESRRQDALQILQKKGADWKQEHEVRAVFTEEEFERDESLCTERMFRGRRTRFLKFEDVWIKSVTIGFRCPEDTLPTLKRIRKKRNAGWKIYRAVLCDKSFQLASSLVNR